MLVQRLKDAGRLFNFATTSHPHALCVGLLAFMHTDAAQHHVIVLILETLCNPVCACEDKHVCIMDDFVPI